MTSSLDQSAPLVLDLEPGLGRSAAMLGLSAGLGGAEMELQKRLIDERITSENHKKNYQTLKAHHTSLQEEFSQVQRELRRLQEEQQTQQEKWQQLLVELRGQLLDRSREVEELRLQVMTPHRLELLRVQVQQEMEAPVRERFNQLEEEAEKYRSEYNKLRYESTILRSQLEHQGEEHGRILEEKRVRYEVEVARLEVEREELLARCRGPDPRLDGKRVEALLREKAQLHMRLKGLEAEVAELRAQKENSGQQAENVQRIQIRQMSEFQSTVKSLEAERQSLRQQLERLEGELRLSHEQEAHLTGRLHKAERAASTLTAEMASLKHAHKLEVADIRLECCRSKGEVERERDSLQGQLDALQAELEVLKAAAEQHKELLLEKEREVVRRVQSTREEELRKTVTLHEEKMELENRLAALEQQGALQAAADQALKEDWEERVRSAEQGEKSARRELQNLRSKLQLLSSQLQEAEGQKAEICDLQQHNQALARSQKDLMETNQRLRETLDRVRDQLRTERSQAERSQHEAERLLESRQVEWLEEKQQLQHKYSELKEKLKRAAAAQKKRKTLTESKERKLLEKIQQLEARSVDLELEAAQKRSSFSEEQAQLRRQLKELQRCHDHFRQLLLGGQWAPVVRTSSPHLVLQRSEGFHQDLDQDLSLLRQRMENLECAQQQQLHELDSLVPRK